MHQHPSAIDAVDEAVLNCLRESEQRRTNWMVVWLAHHPDRAAELARFLAASRDLEEWTGSLRDSMLPESGVTVDHVLGATISLRGEIPGYKIQLELGRGGMGIVYQAEQVGLNRIVALKTVRRGEFASPREMARFRFEAETVALLEHEHIVPIFQVGEQDGILFYSMKHVAGGSLAQRIRKEPILNPKEAAQIVAIVARAVHHAHQRGILHRDLKPANILLDEMAQPHVSDFGLARQLDAAESLGATGAVAGTPEYMAPEQARGDQKLTPAVDVYGLGAILYTCLTGRPPFKGENALETMARVQRDPVIKPRELNSSISAELEAICLRCLAKDPADRYPSAEAVAVDLDRYLRGDPIGERPSTSTLLWKAMTRPLDVQGLITLPAIWWSAGITLVWHGSIFLLGWYEQPAGWIWFVWIMGILLGSVVTWHTHLLSPRSLITLPEMQSAALHFGALLGGITLLFLATFFSPGSSSKEVVAALCPSLLVLYGLTTFAHGVTHWVGFCFAGLVAFPLSVLCAMLPLYSPLILGVYHGVLYTGSAILFARHLRKKRSLNAHLENAR